MVRRLSSVVLAMLVGSLACSSGSGTPSTGGSGSCDTVCNRMGSLGCTNFNAAECVSECQQNSAEELNACPSESASYLGCLQQLPMECDADGAPTLVNDDDAVFGTCGTQALALTACVACLADADDTTCEACQKQMCCNERKAFYSDPAVLQLYNCIQACPDGDSSCQLNCSNQYPSVVSKTQAMNDCEQSKCGC